jgi:hypothetical protein
MKVIRVKSTAVDAARRIIAGRLASCTKELLVKTTRDEQNKVDFLGQLSRRKSANDER